MQKSYYGKFLFVFKQFKQLLKNCLTIFSNSEYAELLTSIWCTAIVMAIEKQLQLSMQGGFQIGKLLIQEFSLTYITG